MTLKKLILASLMLTFVLALAISANAQVKKKKTVKKTIPKKTVATKKTKMTNLKRVRLITDSGTIMIVLYDKTPLHRDNFLKLVEEHYYDSLLFHRVIPAFMIQGGDPDSKNAEPGKMLGMGGPGYRIPAEFDSSLFHKKGALAAAREGDQVNPKKESSGSQFYIVQGKTYTESELAMLEARSGKKMIPSQREIYKTLGGTPFLDMNYTVFGEIESGFDVIDKIAMAQKDGSNRPLTDIRMRMEVVK